MKFVWFICRELSFSADVVNIAQNKNFVVKGYAFSAVKQKNQGKRIVRIGLIQNSVILPTTSPVEDQVMRALEVVHVL